MARRLGTGCPLHLSGLLPIFTVTPSDATRDARSEPCVPFFLSSTVPLDGGASRRLVQFIRSQCAPLTCLRSLPPASWRPALPGQATPGRYQGENPAIGTRHVITAVISGQGNAHDVRDLDTLSRQGAVEARSCAEIEDAPIGTHQYVTTSC